MTARDLQPGDVVQLDPSLDTFGGCFMLITEPGSWGAQGFVSVPGRGSPREAYYRAPWNQMEYVGRAPYYQAESDAESVEEP